MTKYRSVLSQFNRDIPLLLCLMGLVFLTSTYKLTFIYGITITFASIFLFLILRIYGLATSIITGLLTFLFIPKEMSHIAYQTIFLLEIVFVGLFFLKGRKAKMFYVDVLFWVLIGGALLFFMNREFLSGYALPFKVCKDIINALVNVLIADMLLAYFPFYKLLKSNRLSKNNVSIHQFLAHITLLSALLPFYVSVTTNTINIYESISTDLVEEARMTATRVEKQIRALKQNGLVDPSVLRKILFENESQEYVMIIEQNKRVLAATNDQEGTSSTVLAQKYRAKEIKEHFYEFLPLENKDIQPIVGHLYTLANKINNGRKRNRSLFRSPSIFQLNIFNRIILFQWSRKH
ncbi:hypothetical protein [Robertmurraya andreesenii]|uniref:Uncharacterized protein n=1 Tax=Anoxybacillus andreesenii TaxID=1325932 RepID=A0ABT9V5Q3_9BACL|nr:hypothetical protein [Robertmurraya andreesenii]MDQ0156277.1 hypothetical protein [Robertmurraya andreesenii]